MASDLVGRLDVHVENTLRSIGLSTREVQADWAKVHQAMRDAIPASRIAPMVQGGRLAQGFGLGSDTGTGKTMAVAALLKVMIKKRLRWWAETLPERVAKEPHHSHPVPPHGIRWISWPDTVTWLRAHAVDGQAETLLEQVEGVRLLVLDDLGRERIKGSYLEDWAASQLDRVVNHRYREMLPTIWTTNLREEQLTAIYGAALLSRLVEDAPLIWLDGIPSQRLR